MSRIDSTVGKYHWLRIGLVKIVEAMQMNLGLFEESLASNTLLLEFYELCLSRYSPYLGLQYCLSGKLLNHLIYSRMLEIRDIRDANPDAADNDDDDDDEETDKLIELGGFSKRACELFEKGLKILINSHGLTPFVESLIECHQTAQINFKKLQVFALCL